MTVLAGKPILYKVSISYLIFYHNYTDLSIEQSAICSAFGITFKYNIKTHQKSFSVSDQNMQMPENFPKLLTICHIMLILKTSF